MWNTIKQGLWSILEAFNEKWDGLEGLPGFFFSLLLSIATVILVLLYPKIIISALFAVMIGRFVYLIKRTPVE
jgi:hypothetical protein